MLFGNDRTALRRQFADAWRKHCAGKPVSPLDAQIAAVVELHPEYQSALTGDLDTDYTPERGQANPFLHMSLHLGLREQLATNRPAGIAKLFQNLQAKTGDAHSAEHQMIDCLAETLWESQRNNTAPDEAQYLERLRQLL